MLHMKISPRKSDDYGDKGDRTDFLSGERYILEGTDFLVKSKIQFNRSFLLSKSHCLIYTCHADVITVIIITLNSSR